MSRTTRGLALILAASCAAPAGLAQQAEPQRGAGGQTLRAPAPDIGMVVRPSGGGADRFELAPGGGTGPFEVTFDQCNTAANNTCKHGVSDISHDEPSGSCSFSCFAAPG